MAQGPSLSLPGEVRRRLDALREPVGWRVQGQCLAPLRPAALEWRVCEGNAVAMGRTRNWGPRIVFQHDSRPEGTRRHNLAGSRAASREFVCTIVPARAG